MFNEVVDELNILLNNQDVGPALQIDFPSNYAEAMACLVSAQLMQGDLESAQNSIYRLRNVLQRWPIHISEVRQLHAKYSESLSLVEYYISNLQETHTVCAVKGELKPPIRDPDDPDKIILDQPSVGYEIVSKTDGSPFTLEDFRKAIAVPIVDPFPVYQAEPK
jgi:hypothetical protein